MKQLNEIKDYLLISMYKGIELTNGHDLASEDVLNDVNILLKVVKMINNKNLLDTWGALNCTLIKYGFTDQNGKIRTLKKHGLDMNIKFIYYGYIKRMLTTKKIQIF